MGSFRDARHHDSAVEGPASANGGQGSADRKGAGRNWNFARVLARIVPTLKRSSGRGNPAAASF